MTFDFSPLDGKQDNLTSKKTTFDFSPLDGNSLPSETAANTPLVEAGIKKDVRTYEGRFPERTGNFFGNAWSDVKDTVQGLGQVTGNTVNFLAARPLMNIALGDKDTPLKDKVFTGEGIEDIKNLWKALPQFGEGLKENYGQRGVDMVNWERIKEGKSPIQVDVPGLAQSFYAHPLNLLDFVGVGEIGKIGKLKNLTKGGQVSDFSKTVGNKTLAPKYSENLVFNAGQRLLETEPVQNIVNAIDNAPIRPATDVVADFLGLNPDSRLLGTKGAEVRQAKLIEQANQVKNITERNKAIAENKATLGGLTDVEAKELVKGIESGKTLFNVEPREVINKKIQDFDFNNIKNNIKLIGNEFGENLSLPEIQKRAGNYFKENIQGKSVKHPELGNIMANAISRRKYTSNAGNTLKYQIAPKLNEIVETAKYIGTELPLEGKSNKFVRVHKLGNTANIGGQDVNFLINVGEDAKGNLFYNIDDIIERPLSAINSTARNSLSNNIINDVSEISTPRMREVKNILRDKVNKNAEFYINQGLLDKQTVNDLPVNTYASIKYNKPIAELSDAEKLEALKDIQKMPKEQQPFYIPMMYEDKLRAGDFFANTTKKYKPGELRQRKVGMGLEENRTGGKRVYDPVELANRLDAHRIKMVNTENMINEIIDNFAKPFNMATDKIQDGYVPFNPDAFMKFYRKSIDMNDLAIRKIDGLESIDSILKSSLEQAIKELPEDIKEFMGAVRNNNIYQIPEDVAKTLLAGKNQKGIWEAMLDMGTAGFKRKVLGLSPKWFINNRIGNGIMAALKGVLPQDYINALKIPDELLPETLRTNSMYEAEKTIIGRTGGGDNGFFGNTMRLLGGEFIDTSELKGIKKAQVQLANTLGIPGKVINTLTDAMFNFNQKFEKLERTAAYLHSVDNIGKKMLKNAGQNIVKQDELLKATLKNEEVLNAVLKDVDNTLGDYINMTSTERRIIRKIVPFYSWYRTITRYTLSLPESNPFRANLANKLAMVLEEDETLPEYQRASVPTNFVSERTGKPLLLNYERSVPFSTFGETADNPAGLLSPAIMLPLEAARGRKEFMDKAFVSPNYENVFPYGYASLKEQDYGKFYNELPPIEKFKSLPINYARTVIPALDWAERVGVGSIDNLIKTGEFKPKDALFDTSFGGYNYDDGFYKKPKGWGVSEQLLRMLLPIQQQGEVPKNVKPKREKVGGN